MTKVGVSVSMCCRGRDGAHYAWCATLGGSGHKPGSLEDLIAKAKAASKAAHPSSRPAAVSEPVLYWPARLRPAAAGRRPGIVEADGVVSTVGMSR